MKTNFKYIVGFMCILIIEVLIELYINDKIIRPYIGDVLVMVLMYTFVRGFTDKLKKLPIYLFLFAVGVEVMQYINIVKILGLENNRFLSVIIGSTFDFKDIFCYLVGTIVLIFWEKRSTKLMVENISNKE